MIFLQRKWYPVMSLAVLPLMIAGCKVGPDYAPPASEMPDQWQIAAARTSDPNVLKQWWAEFKDPLLTELIDLAAAANPDLRAATARIAESRAIRSATAGQYAPNVDAVGYYSRSRESENGRFGGFGTLSSDQFNLHSVGVDAAWEIDLFGRIGRSVESAQAALEASVEDYRSVETTLFAEVARSYVELRSTQARIRYAQSNIDIQRKTLELTQGRFNQGLAPKLDVTQSMQNLATTESEIPLLRIVEAAALNRLAVLLGRMPEDVRQQLSEPAGMPQTPSQIAVGIPADILRQRPDIRGAERSLAAQTALIGAATADLYPAFSLTGSFNLQATELSDVGDLSSRAYSFGPGFRWNLFSGNRIRSLVQAQEARTAQLLAAYESAVLLAVEEVENAMVGFVQQRESLSALERSVAAAEESVQLSDTLYRNGLTDFENVLVTQRALALQQDRLAATRGQLLQQAISLYKALGGGWDYPEPQTADAEESNNLVNERQ